RKHSSTVRWIALVSIVIINPADRVIRPAVAVDSVSAGMIGPTAADPLNLAGIVVPGERISANSGKPFTLRDGAAALYSGGTPAEDNRQLAHAGFQY
ncbi:MAG: hypothetical protein ACREBW_07170, partial [Candidatus Micrarchaeaceae archaeon]